VTFIIVVTGWVLFRNENLEYALGVIKQMYSFHFFAGKFAMNNDFLFMAVLALIISLFAITQKTKNIQNKIYGENFSDTGRWVAVLAGGVLFYISLSYVSALNFNPFIYFRF